MKVLVFSCRPYDTEFLLRANQGKHQLDCVEARLELHTAVLARGYPAVCLFVEDLANAEIVETLSGNGTRLIVLRSTGFNNVDLEAADRLGMTVMRVSRYSPYAVAEFAVGMIIALNRKLHRAYNRVREGNFRLDSLVGFDLNGKTVGIVGTGNIGRVVARILKGFGCTLLGYDVTEDAECKNLGVRYLSFREVLEWSDIVTLHIPLTPDTHRMINGETISLMKKGAMLINTSRGALVDTEAVIASLKSGQLGSVGLDVYEEESHFYFKDLSEEIIPDDVLSRLLTIPNVLITGHQAFFTAEAMAQISQTTISNIDDYVEGRTNENVLTKELVRAS